MSYKRIPVGFCYGNNDQHVVLQIGTKSTYPHFDKFLVECTMCSEELGVTNVKVVDYTDVSRKRVFCKKHNIRIKPVKAALRDKDTVSYIYVYKVSGGLQPFCGFGVSQNIKVRTRAHEKKLKDAGYIIEDMEVFETTKFYTWRTEKELKKIFEITPTGIEGFVQEATHYNLYKQVVDTVKTLLSGNGNFKLHTTVSDESYIPTTDVDYSMKFNTESQHILLETKC